MKKLLPLFFLIVSAQIFAQQTFQLTQFFRAPTIYNPGYTGSENGMDIKLGYRNQWTNFDDAPQTYYLSVHSPLDNPPPMESYKKYSLRISNPNIYPEKKLDKIRHGLGGNIIVDQSGAFTQVFGYASYAFHYYFSEDVVLSGGAAGGITNTRVDPDKLQVKNPDGDITYNAIISRKNAVNNFDLNIGLLLRYKKFNLGYAAHQILFNNLLQNTELITERVKIHHFVNASYALEAGSNFTITPGILVKYIRPVKPALDLILRGEYKDLVWAGLSYRTNDAVAAMLGFRINNINISYSYDYTTSEFAQYNSGSHEVVLGLNLFKRKSSNF